MPNYTFYIYILASRTNRVLYIGVTNCLERRVAEHKNHQVPGFTSKYNVEKLVYYESFVNINDAIQREKRLKKWNRSWKDELINKSNPKWVDLYPMLL